jgi:hypothetical protein
MTHLIPMADAAFAANIPPGYDIAGGYLHAPTAYHPWPHGDWKRFPGHRLPIWVGSPDGQGQAEGQTCVLELAALGVPAGSIVALDMETRKDITYTEAFDDELVAAGFRVWVYGSRYYVTSNPPCNGYWVADYTDMAAAQADLQHPHVRAVQWKADQPPGYDVSLVKPWTEGEMWHG